MSILSAADREHFLAHGFVKVPAAVDPDLLKSWVDLMWVRMGYDPADPSTWTEGKIHMPSINHAKVAEVAPKAWAAICELCGGAERIQPAGWSDAFIANFHYGDDQPWVPPTPAAKGWHKDGDFFRHFLDSPEQALLTIVLWTDVLPRGGATFLAADSVGPVARYLAQHPEGILPKHGYEGLPYDDLLAQCSDFREATGQAGDVYLMHPFVLHASSYNALRRPRLITNPPVHFLEPMRFDRPRFEDHCLVEQAILRALGTDRFAFTPTAPRERIVPERVKRQALLKEQELARLKR